MHQFTNVSKQLRNLLRKYWAASAVAVLILSILVWGAPAWAAPVAAPLNQTVPPATPTAEISQAVPTATPRPAEPESAPAEPAPQEEQPNDPDSVPFTFPQTDDSEATGNGTATGNGQEAPATELTAQVTVGTLNMREGPGTTFPVIGALSAGQVVTVTARNEENSWWFVCCVPARGTEGWVSASLLQPNFDRGDSAQLISVFGQPRTVQQPVPTARAAAAPVQAATLPISLTMQITPTFVWQGKTFDIEFNITNPNNQPLRNVELSDELATGITFVEAQGDGRASVTNRNTPGGELIILRWTSIPAGATVQARITVTLDPTLSNGEVIDNLAAIRATNGSYTTDGVTIGLPPVTIPDFR